METVKQVGMRLLFVLLSTAVIVFFSEKAFWYPQGYVIIELILFYAIPVYACFWAIEHFRVRRLSALVLVAALFAFLVEGVLTPVIFEVGLFDPVMPAYFIGWHGLISIIFGWYFIRKWLIHGQWQRLLAGSVLFGLFWGVWSITYWLPESAAEFAQAAAESGANTRWTVAEFGLYALVYTLVLLGGHWLLGRGLWQTSFKMSKGENWFIGLALAGLFATLSLPAAPLGFLKLGVLLAILYLALAANRRHEHGESILVEMAGSVKLWQTLLLLAMPLLATAVYAWATTSQLSETTIRTLLEDIPLLQTFVGAVAFLWAFVATIRPKRKIEVEVGIQS
jgi:hypothetical protein